MLRECSNLYLHICMFVQNYMLHVDKIQGERKQTAAIVYIILASDRYAERRKETCVEYKETFADILYI